DLANPSAHADLHSYARPQEWAVTHVHLDLDVDFSQKVLHGSARLHVEHGPEEAAPEIVLDTRDLTIEKAEYTTQNSLDRWEPTEFTLGESNAILGTALRVKIPAETRMLRIHYRTAPEA